VSKIDDLAAAPTSDHPPGIYRFTEEATMIDLEAPSPPQQRRKAPKRFVIAALVAAAAVVAIALVTIREDDSPSPADQPSPTAAPTVPPRALFGTQAERFAPGTYYVDKFDGTAAPRVFLTLGAGWANGIDEWAILKDGTGGMSFSRPDRVFVDACDASAGFHPGPVTTLDGLTAALTEQGGWSQITTPTDISVNGYSGKQFQRIAPADVTGCNGGGQYAFRSWENGPEGSTQVGWSYYEPGEIETLRVLDVNGTIVIINTRVTPDEQRPAALAELAAMLDSIRIEQA